MNTVTTSVVVCAYTDRRRSQLAEAIVSVRGQQQPIDETAIVIDHNDSLLRRARQQWPDLSGLAVTASGFLQIRWTRLAGPPRSAGSTLTIPSASPDAANAEPVLPLVIDVAAPATPIDARRPTARRAWRILTPHASTGLPPYPRELKRVQRRGPATGPGRYLRSHRRGRRAVL